MEWGTSLTYIKYLPKPLLDDIINNQCIPIIGAGFSLNCDLPEGKQMLLWDQLGKAFANDLYDYPYQNAVDAISAYSYEYSRTKLVEKMTQLLYISEAKAGEVHKSFCRIPFDIVCTTNFDFLLEKGYEMVGRYCLPIIDEEQLSIGTNRLNVNQTSSSITLLKLHGDLHHPNRIVATEKDYDSFLDKFPLISTYLANLLITRTPLFIGYSLDDPDFRQVGQIITNRLGELRRAAYVLLINGKEAVINRYRRRGVNVVNINVPGKSYKEVLGPLFKELREYWIENLPNKNQILNDRTLAEFLLPTDAVTRLCYVKVPYSKHPYYSRFIYPIIEKIGLTPVSSHEIIMNSDNISAKEAALIERAEIMILDMGDKLQINQIYNLLANREKPLYLLVLSNGFKESVLENINKSYNIKFIDISGIEEEENDKLAKEISDWLAAIFHSMSTDLSNAPSRLIAKQEYNAAVVSAVTLLESQVRERIKVPEIDPITQKSTRYYPLTNIIRIAMETKQIPSNLGIKLLEAIKYRNEIVHKGREIEPDKGKEIVEVILKVIEIIQQGNNRTDEDDNDKG